MKLTLDTISKSLNGKELFTDFSLELQGGMRLCICGANGVGKSVLMRIMAGKEDIDKGSVLVGKYVRIGYAEQELPSHVLNTTLLDYVQSAIPNWDTFWEEWKEATQAQDDRKLAELSEQQVQMEERYGYAPEHYCTNIIFGLGFEEKDIHKKLGDFSGGFRERAKLARVLVEGVDILLLDEPINHLDIEAIEWLENFLLTFEGIVVFIAHDRVFMDTVSTHTLYLGGSKPFFRKGTYSAIRQQLEEIEEQKRKDAQKIEKELEDKMAFVERFRAKSTKARQASSRQKMAKKLEKELEQLAPEKKQKVLSFRFPTPHKAEKTLITAEKITKSFTSKALWQNINCTIYNDSVIALVGANGVGKSTLLKVLIGLVEPSAGVISRSSSTVIGYFAQHQTDIFQEDATVLEELRRLSDKKITEEEYMSVLGRFLLGQSYFERPVGTLSGGEKNRLLLASIFLSRANILILDEPTNHLDLETREALADALVSFTGAIVLIAHDRYVLQRVAKEYWHITPYGIVPYYTYAEYTKGKDIVISEDFFSTKTKKGIDGAFGSKKQKNLESINTDIPSIDSNNTAFPSIPATIKQQETLSKEERKKQKQQEAEARTKYYAQYKPKKATYDIAEKHLEQLYILITELENQLASETIYAQPKEVERIAKELHALKKEADETVELLTNLEEELEALQKEQH